MTFQGTVKGGIVVLENHAAPPDGTRVEVHVIEVDPSPTWAEVFKPLIGSATELPDDIAENHDHYIHGAPKQIDAK